MGQGRMSTEPPTLELPAPGARAHRGQLSPLECAPKAWGVQWQLVAGVWMVLGCAGRASTHVHEAFEVQSELGARLGRGGFGTRTPTPGVLHSEVEQGFPVCYEGVLANMGQWGIFDICWFDL